MTRPRGLFVLDAAALDLAYGPEEREAIERHVELVAPPQTRESVARRPGMLSDVEVLFSGWGAPVADAAFLASAPRLRAIFYAAGAVGSWATDALWERGVAVSSASAANAVPVAEYTLATILLSLKHFWRLAHLTKDRRQYPDRDGAPGNYGRTVGLISMGAIARQVAELLRPFDLRVLAYDPYLPADEARRLGVEPVALGELFAASDVVSLHAPLLDETRGLVSGAHLASMRPGATFVNTARGEVVREAELAEVARRRPDLHFVLDVTVAEPLEPSSPLYALPNVTLTPHIAGSVGQECRRMGRYMVEELERYVAGRPLKWAVTPELARHSSHRPAASAGASGPAVVLPPPPASIVA